MYINIYKSPIGLLEIATTEKGLCYINFVEDKKSNAKQYDETKDNFLSEESIRVYNEVINQLDEYFNGERKEFDIDLVLDGTEFQSRVWNELNNIPYGEIRSYKDIAEAIDSPKGYRAVGNANNKNKIPIIIPCHRVVGSNGKLVGYAGGMWRKEWLLNHENNIVGE